MRRAVRLAAVFAACAIAPLAAPSSASDGPPLTVVVDGVPRSVPAGTTLAQAAERLGLAPRAGDLLGVMGRVLVSHAVSGHLLVDGSAAQGATLLHGGERIGVVHAPDVREALVREATRLPSVPANPQTTLAHGPVERVVVRGAYSGAVAAVTFRRTGVPHTPRAVALTFDDGPSRYTREIVRTLRRLRAPATFFATGSQAALHPELIELEAAAGMGIGDHSHTHPRAFARLGRGRIGWEIATAKGALDRQGVRVGLFRPPGGSESAEVVRAAYAHGLRVVLWSVDPQDWRPGIRPRAIARRVLAAVRPGSIVVLHDGGGDRSATVAALPAIVKGIRARGLRLVRLGPRARPVVRPLPPLLCASAVAGLRPCLA